MSGSLAPSLKNTVDFSTSVMNKSWDAGAVLYAPLKNDLNLVVGSGLPTFIRATPATFFDQDGVMRTALSGEARFTGARRVQNLALFSEDFSNVAWTKGGTCTVTGTNQINFPAINDTIYQTAVIAGAIGQTYIVEFTLSGTGTIHIAPQSGGGTFEAANVQITLTSIPTRYSVPITFANSGHIALLAVLVREAGDTATQVIANFAQTENVTDQSNQNPAEYVSNGVLSAPYHGAGVDGVQYFPYLNGNTVSGNVVTQAQGAPIADSTLKGSIPEPLVTNFFLNSGAPVTQTTGSLGTGTYTCWLTGAGSIAISAGTAIITGAGTATAASPVTFTVTVAGTVVCTVAGTPTTGSVENSPFPTSYIATAGAAVTRNADVEGYPASGNILAAQGTVYLEFTPNHAPLAATSLYLWGTYVDANNSTQILHDGTNLIFRKRIAGVNYDATIALTYVSGTMYKMCASWGAGGTTIYLNGTAGTPNANTTAAQIGTTIQSGADGNGAGQPTMQLRNERVWQTTLAVATQGAITQ
jgi:hypothetical protein